jgi:hypothetical protein
MNLPRLRSHGRKNWYVASPSPSIPHQFLPRRFSPTRPPDHFSRCPCASSAAVSAPAAFGRWTLPARYAAATGTGAVRCRFPSDPYFLPSVRREDFGDAKREEKGVHSSARKEKHANSPQISETCKTFRKSDFRLIPYRSGITSVRGRRPAERRQRRGGCIEVRHRYVELFVWHGLPIRADHVKDRVDHTEHRDVAFER